MSDDWIPIGYLNIEIHEIGDNSSSSSGRMFNLLQQQYQPEQPRIPPPRPPEETESRIAYTRRWLVSHDSFFTNDEPYAEDKEPSQTDFLPQSPLTQGHHPPAHHAHPERFHPYARPEDLSHIPRFHPYQQNLPDDSVNLEYPQLPTEYSPLHSSLFLSPQLSPQTFDLSPQPGQSSPQSSELSPPPATHPQLIPPPSEAMQRSPQPVQVFQGEPLPGPSHVYLMPVEESQPMEMGSRESVQAPTQRAITTLVPTPFFVPPQMSPRAVLHSSPIFGSPHMSPRGILASQIYGSPQGSPQRALVVSPQLSPQRIQVSPRVHQEEVQLIQSAEMIEVSLNVRLDAEQLVTSTEMIVRGPLEEVEPMEMSSPGSVENVQEPKGDSPIQYVPPPKKPRMSDTDIPADEDDNTDDDL